MAKLFAEARRLKRSAPEKREFRRFPYAVLYAVEAGVMYVLAVGHVRRGPRYWSRKSKVARE